MTNLARRAAGQIDQHAAGRQDCPFARAYPVLDIIYQAHQARLLAIAGWLLDVATALALPALPRQDFRVALAVDQILIAKGLVGLAQNLEFSLQGRSHALAGCL